MRPVITLTTDFGQGGPFAAVMKAVILARAPDAQVVDLTHHITPCRPGEAGFWLSRCYRYFPGGSVHVAVVDPGVGTERAILACAWDGHVFLAPDNGILPMIAGPDARVHALSAEWLQRQDWAAPSHTFHGRDIFAPLAAGMLTGVVRPADIGPPAPRQALPALPPPSKAGGSVTGRVAAIDTWGNLITNIDSTLLDGLQDPRITIGKHELGLVTTYGAAPAGGLLALVNSFGVVEIAVREGNAAQTLRLGHGAPVTVVSPFPRDE
jgi:S-adenosylmethionine hydrolase